MKKLIFLLAIFFSQKVYSGQYKIPAMEPTQYIMWALKLDHNKKQLSKLIATTITIQTQLRVMKTNTKGLTLRDWAVAYSGLEKLAQITRKGYEISYGNREVEKNFKSKHKGYRDYLYQNKKDSEYFDKKYNQWSNENSQTIADSLRIANKQHTDFSSENNTLTTLNALSKSAKGRMQALQIGNLIALQQIGQIQKLRQLTMAQIQMQSAYMGSETDKETLQKSQIRNFYKPNTKTRVGNGDKF